MSDEPTNPFAPGVLPKVRGAQPARKDPARRPLIGLPQNGITLLNEDPARKYVLVEKGAGHGREFISPSSYQEAGFRVEKWDENGVRFRGVEPGRHGEPMERYGHVLMSVDKGLAQEMFDAQQEYVDPIEKQVMSPEYAVSKGREALAGKKMGPEYMHVASWDGAVGGD